MKINLIQKVDEKYMVTEHYQLHYARCLVFVKQNIAPIDELIQTIKSTKIIIED